MRYVLIIALSASMLAMVGCGGGSGPPAGYSISDGWVTTPSGLKFRDVKTGSGPRASYGKSVSANYVGWLDDGTIFDSNEDPANPFTFTIGTGSVIAGWDQGLQNVPAGSIVELIVPPSLGYGDRPQGSIPANSTLHFRVDIISVN